MAESWNAFRVTGIKGTDGEKGTDGDYGILTLSFEEASMSLQGNGQPLGYVIYHNNKYYMSSTYTCTTGGDGVIIADISQSPVVVSYNKITVEDETLSFVDFNTGENPITKDDVDTQWQYILIGEFSCITDGTILNALLKPTVSASTFLSDEFTSILRKAILEGADIEAWSKAMGCDQYYNTLAVSKLFAGQIFTQELTLTENGVIKSDDEEESVRIQADGYARFKNIETIDMTANGGTFDAVDVSGKFTSSSLETFDAKSDITSSWGLSQSLKTDYVLDWSTNSKSSGDVGKDYNDIAYGNGKYVGVRNDGYISYSTDGITWSKGTYVGDFDIVKVTYGNGKFIAIANNEPYCYLLKSTDGISWTYVKKGGAIEQIFLSTITYNSGTFVAGGMGIASDPQLGAIPFALTYTFTDTSNLTVNSIKGMYAIMMGDYGNGKYSFILNKTNGSSNSYVYYSSNGTSWAEGTTLSYITNSNSRMRFTGNYFFVLCNDGKVYYSSNGSSYKSFTLNTSIDWKDVKYTDGIYVLAGNNGSKGYVAYSYNGTTWTTPVAISHKALCVNGNGTQVVVGCSSGYTEKTTTGFDTINEIYKYLSTLLDTLSAPSGETLPDTEPLLYSSYASGTIVYNSTSYSITKLKAAANKIVFTDSNSIVHTVNASTGLLTDINISNLTIQGASEENHMTAIIPKKGNNTGYIGTEAKKFKEINATTVNATTLSLPTPSTFSNGYVVMPNGLMIQWGYAEISTANTDLLITFPYSFPNRNVAIQATSRGDVAADGKDEIYIWVKSVDNYKYYGVRSPRGGLHYTWLAIGY